ncbi:MAG: ATP synthase F1 subunit gamma [Clostridia bacterium]|jgi:F-type H+-transporting ATPase subunit gamma|nr:ATP synthase F1 subunit gamma [Clostridia bacterium]MCI9459613.1 ATP synthase F1 subunit gamma [Clostridia bacterium]
MNNQADIKRRLASVRQTRQITGAMEMISVSKMRKSLERFDENHIYFDTLDKVVADIFDTDDPDLAEFVRPPKCGGKAVVVLASDKGLCGGFNHDVIKTADGIVTDDTTVIPIGQIPFEHYAAKKRGGAEFALDDGFVGASAPDYGNAKRVADSVLSRYGKEFGSVSLVYTRLVSHAVWQPVIKRLLPVDAEMHRRGEKRSSARAEFEPSACEVFERLLPMYLGGTVYGALVHSAASEHSARRAAMSASAKNADEMIAELSMEYNRARQSAVTEQITEIISSQTLDGQGRTL